MGTITKTFETDQLAQRLFTNWFPPRWLIRPQIPDIHIDYSVEVVENDEPTGLVFGVQLKGTSSPKYYDKYIKFSFEKKHLAYYLDKVKWPVLLVVVDTVKNIGFWIFAQEMLQKSMKPNWRYQKSIEIKIPLVNKLGNIDDFLPKVKHADQYMRELWPGSVAAAATHEVQRLVELDDRFLVNVKFDKGVTHYEFNPKEDISGQIIVQTKAAHKLDDLLKKGNVVQFEPGEFYITGSKVFDVLISKYATHGIKVNAARTIECDGVISLVDSADKEVYCIHGLKVTMKGGYEEVNIKALLPNSALSLNFHKTLGINESKGDMNISLNLECWVGKPLLFLSYFEQLLQLITLIEPGYKIIADFTFEGNLILKGVTPITKSALFLKEPLPYLTFIDNARFICRKFGINPILPHFDTITDEHTEGIHLLRNVIETGEHRQPGVGIRATGRMKVNETLLSLAQADDCPEAPIRIDQKRVHLFGYLIKDLQLTHVITCAKIVDESRMKLAQSRTDDEIELEWHGLEGSEYIITQLIQE